MDEPNRTNIEYYASLSGNKYIITTRGIIESKIKCILFTRIKEMPRVEGHLQDCCVCTER